MNQSTQKIPAHAAGTFKIAGEIEINRLGFGAMRIVGKGVWGEPADRNKSLATLKLTQELGINFIDTADSYGPFISEDLICEALYPYPKGLLIATKGGHTRHGPDIWRPIGNTDYLRQCVLMSMRRLKCKHIDLWQLHRVGKDVSPEEQFEAIAQMQKEGLIRHIGLSEVDVEMIERTKKYFNIVTVQNRFNLFNRNSEDVLNYCEKHHIGFIPWAPLNAGKFAESTSVLKEIAHQKDATVNQIALAWLLKRSPVILPIPGTGSPEHLRENVASVHVKLTDHEFERLNQAGEKEWQKMKEMMNLSR